MNNKAFNYDPVLAVASERYCTLGLMIKLRVAGHSLLFNGVERLTSIGMVIRRP